jgi:hypothetical protein
MKKIMSFFLSLAAVGVITFSAESQAAASPVAVSAQQVRVQIGQRRRHARFARTFTQTRVVRRGYGLYRETYRVTTFPNGRTTTMLIGRIRIR